MQQLNSPAVDPIDQILDHFTGCLQMLYVLDFPETETFADKHLEFKRGGQLPAEASALMSYLGVEFGHWIGNGEDDQHYKIEELSILDCSADYRGKRTLSISLGVLPACVPGASQKISLAIPCEQLNLLKEMAARASSPDQYSDAESEELALRYVQQFLGLKPGQVFVCPRNGYQGTRFIMQGARPALTDANSAGIRSVGVEIDVVHFDHPTRSVQTIFVCPVEQGYKHLL